MLTRRHATASLIGVALLPGTALAAPPTYRVRRLVDRPIVTPGMDARMGSDIEGPSLIRAPDWLPNRLGRYYLYFADHKGDYIRLAYADRLEGPWKIHAPGSLQLAQSGFPTVRPPDPPDLAERQARAGTANRAPESMKAVPTRYDDATIPHIASPDVHIDEKARRIVMYYHGLESFGEQRTRLAYSSDGITFTPTSDLIEAAYLRVFNHSGFVYGLSMPGMVARSRDGRTGWERGPRLFASDQRHCAVLVRGNTLHIFWTRVGDAPERIYASTIDLAADWKTWKPSDPVEVIRPERDWEGANLPVAPSYRSAVFEPVNQLRDPAIYEEGGRIYLAYAVKGEAGIGIAELFVP